MSESICATGKRLRTLVLALMLSVMMLLAATPAGASSTLFTYSGSGIWSKASVSTATLSSASECYVRHTQSRNNKGTDRQMTVSIQLSDGWFSYETVGSKTFSNEVTNQVFSTYCAKGTYRLYFYTGSAYSKFDISGTFYH